jgi:nitrogen PTS system EIIA component
MKLKQYLKKENVFVAESVTKAEVLKESATVCADSTGLDGETLLDAINHREKLMSTGIGQGLGIPHVRLAGIKHPALTVAICPGGIKDYTGMDTKPVNIVVLIAAPQGQHETYIRLLAAVVEVLNQPELREKVLTAETPQDAYKILIGEK